jgi:hypothetical protein
MFKENKYTLEKTKRTTKNGQSRETGNIGHTGHRTKTDKIKTQHRKLKRWATRTPPKYGAFNMSETKHTMAEVYKMMKYN